MSAILLDVRDLSARYGKVQALQPVSLQLTAGQIVTVIGANGAGKSTLLNAVMGALPVSGSATGQVAIEGVEVSRWPVERRVAAGMSLVPEKRELFASMSVADNLLLGGFRRYRAREAGWRDTLDEVYALFPRLKERHHQEAGTLSGGERQMLAVGRALMAKPRILMLDLAISARHRASCERYSTSLHACARRVSASYWSNRMRVPPCKSPTTAMC